MERDLHQLRAARSEVLYKLALLSSETVDSSRVPVAMIEKARSVLAFDRCTLTLLDDSAQLSQIRTLFDVRQETPTTVEDAILSLPLVAFGITLGALTFGTTRHEGFDPDDLAFAAAVAAQLAPVIAHERQALQLEHVQREVARLGSFPELNPAAIIEMDLAGSVHYFNPAAQKLFPGCCEGRLRLPPLGRSGIAGGTSGGGNRSLPGTRDQAGRHLVPAGAPARPERRAHPQLRLGHHRAQARGRSAAAPERIPGRAPRDHAGPDEPARSETSCCRPSWRGPHSCWAPRTASSSFWSPVKMRWSRRWAPASSPTPSGIA